MYTANTLLSTVDINMTNTKEWDILDSGATSHFLVIAAPKCNVQPEINPLVIKLPDGAQVRSTAMCILAFPQLPAKAREGHIISDLAAHSILSVVWLRNA